MISKSAVAAAAASALMLGALLPQVVFGSDLSKAAKAVAYPVKKAATNASIDTHRALGHNSVEHRKLPYHRRRNLVITPTGHMHPAHPNSNYWYHGRHYYHYDGHLYYKSHGRRHKVS